MLKITAVIVLQCLFIFFDFKVMGSSSDGLNSTRHRRRAGDIECILPPFPEHGKWKLLSGEGKQGDTIPKSSPIMFECNPGYWMPVENQYWLCDKRWKSRKLPQCEKLCPPLFSSDIFELTCRDKTGKEIECDEATHGSFVEFECARFYEIPIDSSNTIHCEDGKWNSKPICQPICGDKIVNDTKTLVYGSKPNEKLEYPWIIALYQKDKDSYMYNCGGSILSPTIVLTAAHCVTNSNGDVLPKENYVVGAGKLYVEYKAPKDTQAQYLEVSDIKTRDSYKGESRRYLGDIAVLVMKGEFVLTEAIQPVCFKNIKNIRLRPGNLGEVSGWGRTEDEMLSEKLRTLIIPYKYELTCAQELPEEWANIYNLEDKICAGFINQSTSVCDGDSGGGLAFKNRDGKYYVHGIVSLAHQTESHCNIQQNALYTKVSFYYDFVDQLMTKYAPKIKDCKLPPHPEDGVWIIEGQDKEPGDAVASDTLLRIECDSGFILSSPSAYIKCGAAHNMPTCQVVCPDINLPEGSNYQCINAEQKIVNCWEAVEGTKVTYNCPMGFVPKRPENITCENGQWKKNPPMCRSYKKTCGETQGDSRYPWNVAIYKIDDKNYEYICGATLLEYNIILTAAQCITDEYGELLPKEDYVVAAGKLYSKYNDSRDKHAQYSEISKMTVHLSYRGKSRNYFSNIALLEVETPFQLNEFVNPVCIDEFEDLRLEHKTGVIPGWEFREGVISDKPHSIELVYKGRGDCEEYDAFNFNRHIFDKLCAGLDNETICLNSRDSGRGFSVKNPKDNRYYVKGIVVVDASINWTCQHDVTLIDLFFYKDFLTSHKIIQFFLLQLFSKLY